MATTAPRLPACTSRSAAVASSGRAAAAQLWRRLPARVGSRWRYIDPLNRALLRAGAPVVAETRMRAGHRMRLDLRSGTEWLAYYTGSFDDARIRVARDLLRPSGVAVDAGANVGLWTVPLAREAADKGASVLACEPVPANVQRLTENLAVNDVQRVVRVEPLALSDTTGHITMSLREDFADGAGTGNASVSVTDGEDDGFDAVHVATATLDDVIDRCGRPRVDVLKVDVEGHEDRLLTGSVETFARDRPVAFVEWNPVYYHRRGVDPTALVTPLLREWDYRSLRMVDGRCEVSSAFTSDKPLDDLVLLPAERQQEVEARMASSYGSVAAPWR